MTHFSTSHIGIHLRRRVQQSDPTSVTTEGKDFGLNASGGFGVVSLSGFSGDDGGSGGFYAFVRLFLEGFDPPDAWEHGRFVPIIN